MLRGWGQWALPTPSTGDPSASRTHQCVASRVRGSTSWAAVWVQFSFTRRVCTVLPYGVRAWYDTMASRHDRASCGVLRLWVCGRLECIVNTIVYVFLSRKPTRGRTGDPARGGAERLDGAHMGPPWGPRDRLVETRDRVTRVRRVSSRTRERRPAPLQGTLSSKGNYHMTEHRLLLAALVGADAVAAGSLGGAGRTTS